MDQPTFRRLLREVLALRFSRAQLAALLAMLLIKLRKELILGLFKLISSQEPLLVQRRERLQVFDKARRSARMARDDGGARDGAEERAADA